MKDKDLHQSSDASNEEVTPLSTDPSAQKEDEPHHESLSLDDIAARLVQLGPRDSSDLESIREDLMAMAQDESAPGAVRTLVAEAMLKIDDVLRGSNAETSLTEANQLIERAFTARDNPEDPVALTEDPQEEDKKEDLPAVEFSPDLQDDADLDILKDFVVESLECIESAEGSLLALEVDPDDIESVNTVFRAFHTIKGNAGFLGLQGMASLAHRAETLLSRIRDREIRYNTMYADLSLRSVDLLKEIIDSVHDALEGQPMSKPEGYDELMVSLADPEDVPRLGDLLVAEGQVSGKDVEAAVGDVAEPTGPELVKSQQVQTSDEGKMLRRQSQISTVQQSKGDSSVRVRTDRLDSMIDLVGELVIAYSMVAQDPTVVNRDYHLLSKNVAQTGKLVRELQGLSMSMRMVPLKPTFQKMARLVRDLAHKAGKQVQFLTDGEDTEIDRNMVDVIRDPLVHMVRNAVDHGIESPHDREKNGKPGRGTVRLVAHHSGGNIVIELHDDGRGANREKILEKALSKGLIESEKSLSDSEVFRLIFEPGFSTADKVTDVSGRGVGLDVVRRNVESLRGRIDVSSDSGKGSSFSMILPLTLAVTDGMLVRVAEERYIIPTIDIFSTIRPQEGQVSTVAGRGEMLLLRGELMPMFRLYRLFGVQGAKEDPLEALLVIAADGDRRCAIQVDELLGQHQVVAKSLGEGIGQIRGVSGGAILGDGRVGLILDTEHIMTLARTRSSDDEGNGYRLGTNSG